MANDDSVGGKDQDFFVTLMDHAKNLNDFEKRHHRSGEVENQSLIVASLESLGTKAKSGRPVLRRRAEVRAAGVIKIFRQATEKDSSKTS